MLLTSHYFHFKRTGYIHILVLVFLTLMLSACTSTWRENSPVKLDGYSEYQLQAVPLDLQKLTTLQQLIVTSNTAQHQLLLQTELYADQIKMVGLSPSGLLLFELSWTEGISLELSSNVPIDGLDPDVILAYYQLSNWPAKDIFKGLVGMRLEISSQLGEKREFYRAEQLVFSVEHHGRNTKLVHHLDDYQIEIITLERGQIE